jgi:hypothetical protein
MGEKAARRHVRIEAVQSKCPPAGHFLSGEKA